MVQGVKTGQKSWYHPIVDQCLLHCANKDLAVIRRKFLHPNNLSEFLDLTDIHGHLISPYAKWVEQWV